MAIYKRRRRAATQSRSISGKSDARPESERGYRLRMRRQLVKDRAAEADLIGIWVYSFKQWSESQAEQRVARFDTRWGG
jgi:hypothetical protein